MPVLRLIHWNAPEAQQRALWLEALGYRVDYSLPSGPTWIRSLVEHLPQAVVIDLSRLPSQGRDFGILLRFHKATRFIPLVFVGGEAVKVARVRQKLPDAVYTTWEEIDPVLEEAIDHPLKNPIVPKSVFDGYSGQPLVKKLGIKPGMKIGLLFVPQGFTQMIGELPEGAVFVSTPSEPCDLLIWFARSKAALDEGILALSMQEDFRALWIAWPKKSSGVATDLSENVVRYAGLSHDLVDYKICSIDETWSGLLFSRRSKSSKKPLESSPGKSS